MQVIHNLFPGGVQRALTMSYDDGQIFDRRLVELLNQYGIKGTFHLNSGKFDEANFIDREEVKTLYMQHEVSAHTTNHPFLTDIPDVQLLQEIIEDKKELESLCGYPVRGMSYPFGRYSNHVIEVARSCGVEYSRTVESNNWFNLPEDFMKWHPTTHHNGDLMTLWENFIGEHFQEPLLFYIWGHSYEFDRDNNWNQMEKFCKMAGRRDDIWYATNIQIKEYADALKRLVYSADSSYIYNPSAIHVWVTVDQKAVCVKSGTTWKCIA